MQLSESRHCECAETLRPAQWAPSVDAQASDIRTGIREPKLNEHGVPDKSRSRWFTLEITKEEWPRIYDANRRGEVGTKVQVMPTWTDNRGNGAALSKLMTILYPAGALIMDMSAYFKRVRIKALVEWTPSSANWEADALANGDTPGFDPELEVKIDDKVLRVDHFPEGFHHGGRWAEETFQAAKSRGELPEKSGKQRKRKPEERLKFAMRPVMLRSPGLRVIAAIDGLEHIEVWKGAHEAPPRGLPPSTGRRKCIARKD